MYTRQQLVKKGLLLAAVAGVFAACQQGNKPAADKSNSAAEQSSSVEGAQKIAYVDIDSVEVYYNFFKEKKAELEKKKEGAQNDLGARERQLQNEYNALAKRAPTMTQSEGEAAQASLERKARSHEEYRQTLFAQLQTQEAQFNEDLQKRLNESIKKFNADKKYAFIFSYRDGASNILYKDEAYDVTQSVIKELNAADNTKK